MGVRALFPYARQVLVFEQVSLAVLVTWLGMQGIKGPLLQDPEVMPALDTDCRAQKVTSELHCCAGSSVIGQVASEMRRVRIPVAAQMVLIGPRRPSCLRSSAVVTLKPYAIPLA